MSGGGGAAVRRKMDIGSANFRCFLILNFAILGAEEDYPMEAKKKVVVALGHSALGVTTKLQKDAMKQTSRALADLVEAGYQLTIRIPCAPSCLPEAVPRSSARYSRRCP